MSLQNSVNVKNVNQDQFRGKSRNAFIAFVSVCMCQCHAAVLLMEDLADLDVCLSLVPWKCLCCVCLRTHHMNDHLIYISHN